VIVRTVLGDIAPEALGLTLGHEHLIARPPGEVTDPDLRLDEQEAAAAELAAFAAAGGGAVVEMTTVDYGRDVAALRLLSRTSGVHVVAATGFNKARFSDPIVARHDDETLARWMIDEVRVGAQAYAPAEAVTLRPPGPGAGAREGEAVAGEADRVPRDHGPRAPAVQAGLIKFGTGEHGAGPQERRAMEAAIRAHHATGAPIGTHTEHAVWALEQAQALTGAGVAPASVLIGHCDFRPELPYLLEVAATGVNVGLDQFSKRKYLPDEARVALVVGFAEAGRLGQLILGGDLARRSYWPAFGHAGAAGFAHIPTTVADMLRAAGLSEADLAQVLRDNPRRWLSFEPR
jgi:5-phospho-D-xylono-1,4-lactonase